MILPAGIQASSPSLLEKAFIQACSLDVTTLKPGNVSEDAPGHRMTAAQFIASAGAAAPLLCRAGAPVGQRIFGAVEASLRVAGCNTNLGIVLLCAPIAAAAQTVAADADLEQWRRRLSEVLRSLTVADADAAFRAIALANPAGLGTIEAHDVQASATIDLRAAMSLAAGRDMIARQYAGDFEDLFEVGMTAWREACNPRQAMDGRPASLAMQRVFLEFLARFPDSHIARKHGTAVAEAVSRQAQSRLLRWRSDASAVQADLADWDAQLKSAGVNPGTSADLAVATAFLAGIVLHRSTMPTAGRDGVMLNPDGADDHPEQRLSLHCITNVRGAH